MEYIFTVSNNIREVNSSVIISCDEKSAMLVSDIPLTKDEKLVVLGDGTKAITFLCQCGLNPCQFELPSVSAKRKLLHADSA